MAKEEVKKAVVEETEVATTNLEKFKWDCVDNFLDEDHLQEILEMIEKNENWTDTSKLWEESMFVSGEIKVQNNIMASKEWGDAYKSNDNPIIGRFQKKVIDYFKKEHNIDILKHTNAMLGTTIFKYPEQSCIFWHDDGMWDYAIIYYTNDMCTNCGGELLLEPDFWIEPVRNRLAIIKPPLMHRTTKLELNSPDRVTLQSFLSLDKEKIYAG